jgi:hypothetical protein
MFIREPLSVASASFSPLKANLEDMIATCSKLDEQLAVIAEDGEEFGGLSEESFCYTAPVCCLEAILHVILIPVLASSAALAQDLEGCGTVHQRYQLGR